MKTTILLNLVVLLVAAASAPAATRLVPDEYATIQDAIDAAVDGDVVVLAPITYSGNGNRDIDFHGKDITIRSVDPNDPDTVAATIIDCNGTLAEKHRGFYFHSGEDYNSVVCGLTITNGYAERGGAIYCISSSPTLTNCIFRDSTAKYWSQSISLTLFEDTEAMVNDGNGVHIMIPPPDPQWRGDGGGINCCSSNPLLTNCKFIGNWAYDEGGGMLNYRSSPTLINCTFSGNSAHTGGGIANWIYCRPTLANCTFTSNSSTNGNAVSCDSMSSSYPNVLEVINCILYDGGDEIWNNDNSTITVTYSDIQGGWPGEGNIDAEPCFSDPCAGDYHLLAESPCIDSGDLAYIPSFGETDIDGEPRVIGGRIDMGAYEYQGPQILYVDADAPNDPGPGHPEISDPLEDGTQAHPFDAIQEAIDAAEYHDNVIILNGTYTGDGNRDIDFRGKAITVRSIDPNDPNIVAATVIDCEGRARGFNFHSGEDTNSVLAGLTVTNGSADDGCGIYINSSSPLITRCAIIGNSSHRRKVDGGGIYIRDGNPIISHCMVSENSIGNYSTYGGGIYCLGSNPVITHCTITNNYVRDRGGGIHCQSSSPLISHCIIKGNTASHRIGGGICSWGASPIITNCLITLNSSGDGGGGISLVGSNAAISQCTITGNSDRWFGGGIYFSLGSTIITNSILWGNTAPNGPEIAVNSWGGIMPDASEGMVRNSEPDYTSELTVSYSDVKGGQMGVYVFNDPRWFLLDWGDDNIDADPYFVQPRYWEPPLPPPSPPPPSPLLSASSMSDTLQYIWVEGDYHLLPYSVCIDAGDPNYMAEPNETDLDGKPRVMGGRIDMGAYETIPPIPAEVRIVPRTINLASRGKWITCYIWLPDDYSVADIDSNSIFLYGKIQAESVQVNEKQQVAIAEFSREDVQTILNIGEIELSIIGWLTDATYFEGKDIIKVTNKRGEKPDKNFQAGDPSPPDGATDIDINADLSWTADKHATSHDVYFGTGSLPPFVCNQTSATFDPGTMGYGTTYYWRIDEVNKFGKTTGQVWSFTTIEGPVPPPPP